MDEWKKFGIPRYGYREHLGPRRWIRQFQGFHYLQIVSCHPKNAVFFRKHGLCPNISESKGPLVFEQSSKVHQQKIRTMKNTKKALRSRLTARLPTIRNSFEIPKVSVQVHRQNSWTFWNIKEVSGSRPAGRRSRTRSSI